MDDRSGCLGVLRGFWRWNGSPKYGRKNGNNDKAEGPMPNQVSASSIELFALPGHGRTTYLWSLLFMLRQLSRVWPGYLCWPIDEASGKSLLRIHERLRLGELPDRWSDEGGSLIRHALHLKNLNPWGERYFVVWDWPDQVFCTDRSAANGQSRPHDWNVPAVWLLSLPDLDEVRGRFLDLALDQMVRVRMESGEAAREVAFRLVVVLTKADAIAELPTELRAFLREDPLALALASRSNRPFRPHDQIDLPSPPSSVFERYPAADPLREYFEARRSIHELTRDWLESTSGGRALLRRAEELQVELRFSVVSATGSGLANDGRLATAWVPRRVLDPYFWSLELGA